MKNEKRNRDERAFVEERGKGGWSLRQMVTVMVDDAVRDVGRWDPGGCLFFVVNTSPQ